MLQPTIVLGSSSPRRQDTLKKMNLDFIIIKPQAEEILNTQMLVNEAILELAISKNQEIQKCITDQNSIIITADTMVVFGDIVIGKPKDANQAKDFLQLLSGTTHRVITGHCIYDTRSQVYYNKYISTEIDFKVLSETEISNYIATGEPMDKAGGYGGQGLAGYFITETRGDYDSFIGLSKAFLYESLVQCSVNVW